MTDMLNYPTADDIRNAVYNQWGTIDLEYNHPGYGWIPFTASPNDPEEHGREIYALASEGAVADYETPPIEEQRAGMPPVTARQLRLTLVRNGYSLSTIDAAIQALPDGQEKDEAEIEWEYAAQFERLAPTLLTIALALNISPEDIDAMWAAALTA